MIARACVTLAIWLVAWPLNVYAERDLSQRLTRMASAAQQFDYTGVLVFAHGAQVDTLKVKRSQGRQGMREYIRALNGSPRQVIREGERVTCIMPDSQAVLVRNGGLPGTAEKLAALDLQRLGARYRFHVSGRDRIAGRQTDVLEIRPVDEQRYGYRMWQDRQTGLLMRFDILDAQGSKLESMMFSEFVLGKRTSARVMSVKAEIAPMSPMRREAENPENNERIQGLPQGFRQTFQRRLETDQEDTFMDQRVFSDGLASVSLFIESVEDAKDSGERERFSIGALNAWSLVKDARRITAVGEVPEAVARRFAETARW